MMISFIKGKTLSKPTWPYVKNELNFTNPSMNTARPVESINHLNRNCLTKWSMLKEQQVMPQSIEIQEQNSWHVSVWKVL